MQGGDRADAGAARLRAGAPSLPLRATPGASELRVMLCVRTDLGMKVAVQGLWFMFYVLCFMLYVSCFMLYVLCFLFYVLHFNLHAASFNLQCHAPTHLILY